MSKRKEATDKTAAVIKEAAERILLLMRENEDLTEIAKKLKTENQLMSQWIEDDGARTGVCTYNILRKICPDCRCNRGRP